MRPHKQGRVTKLSERDEGETAKEGGEQDSEDSLMSQALPQARRGGAKGRGSLSDGWQGGRPVRARGKRARGKRARGKGEWE